MQRFAHNSLWSWGTPRILGPLTTEETNSQLLFLEKQAQKSRDIEQDCVALNLHPNWDGILECRAEEQGSNMEPVDQRVPPQSTWETACTAGSWRRYASCWWCGGRQNRGQEQRKVAAVNHQEFNHWTWRSRLRSKIACGKVLHGTCYSTTLSPGTIMWQTDASTTGVNEPRSCSISPKMDGMLQLQCNYVYKKLPKRRTEMNGQNEQCYQLAFSWQTDIVEKIVLFPLENWLSNMMSVIILFKVDRS